MSVFSAACFAPTGFQARRISLPLRCGGLGLRTCGSVALVAFACSSKESLSGTNMFAPLTTLTGDSALEEALLAIAVVHQPAAEIISTADSKSTTCFGLQSRATQALEVELLAGVVADASEDDAVRVSSCQHPWASSWIFPPQSRLGDGLIPAAEFRVLLRHRLGAPLRSPDEATICSKCHNVYPEGDIGGYHALTCSEAGARGRAHTLIVKSLFGHASQGLLNPHLEQHPFASAPTLRLDICFLHQGKNWLLDVAVTHALRPVCKTSARLSPGGASTQYEGVKRNKYGSFVDLGSQKLCPMVVDTFGAWGVSAAEPLAVIGAAYAKRKNSSIGRAEFRARLGGSVQRAIAALLLGVETA